MPFSFTVAASARPVDGVNNRKLPVYSRTLGTEEFGMCPEQDLDAGDEHNHDRQPHEKLLTFDGHAASTTTDGHFGGSGSGIQCDGAISHSRDDLIAPV